MSHHKLLISKAFPIAVALGLTGLSAPAAAEIHMKPAISQLDTDFTANIDRITRTVSVSKGLVFAPEATVKASQDSMSPRFNPSTLKVEPQPRPSTVWNDQLPVAQPLWNYKQKRIAINWSTNPDIQSLIVTPKPLNINIPDKPQETNAYGLANLASLLLGKTAVAQEISNIRSAVTALDMSMDITDGSFTGTMATDTNRELTMAENLLVARAESTFRSVVSAPASAFVNPENRANRPAGLYQIGAIEFGSMLAQHKSNLKLSPELNRSFAPLFGTLDKIAEQYAHRTGRNVTTVLARPYLFGQAFKSATLEQKEIVRRARTDTAPVVSAGGTTTKGALLSTITKLYIADSALKAPESMVKQYGRATLRYAEHVFGRGGALAITGLNPRAVSAKWMSRALRANPIAPTRATILDNIRNKKFGLLDTVASALGHYMPRLGL